MAYLEYFDQELIELQEEIFQHPQLCNLLQNHPAGEIESRFAEIAAYCGILLDGGYTPEDFPRIAKLCTHKLREKRVQLILPLNS